MPILIAFLVLIGCGSHHEKIENHNDIPPVEDLSQFGDKYFELQQRLLSEFLDADFPISRNGDEIKDRGDSALFAGIAVGTLGCDEGRPIYDALQATVRKHGGLIYRHPRLETATLIKHGPSSRDAMIGVQFGLVSRWRRCPDDRQAIAELWALHRSYVEGLGNGRLFPGAGEDKQINGGLFWLWDRVANFFGINADAPRVTKERFQTDLIATASGIVSTKQSCYPLHLNILQMITAFLIDSPVNSFTRFSWCSATTGTGNPMVEWFCEREPARLWLDSYSPNAGYKYRHEKCKWQEPNGTDEVGPGLDFLFLKRLADHEILGVKQ